MTIELGIADCISKITSVPLLTNAVASDCMIPEIPSKKPMTAHFHHGIIFSSGDSCASIHFPCEPVRFATESPCHAPCPSGSTHKPSSSEGR